MARPGPRPSPDELARLPVAVDAMGGDQAPEALVEGSLVALQQDSAITVILVGQPERLDPLLRGRGGARVLVEPSEGAIPMDAHPAQAVRAQPRASVNVAIGQVAGARAEAPVSPTEA